MQLGTMRGEPGFGSGRLRANALDQPPEGMAVVHLDQMRDLVRGEIVEHEGWRQDQPPGLGHHSAGRA